MPDNIFTSCRKGDLSRVQYLVEQKEIDLNVRDCWDSTPLYYACLCGHIDVVKYLLNNGARCEANTFDGERCFYSALTDQIKRVLLEAKVLTPQIKRRNDYDEFCERLLKSEEYSDVTFRLQEGYVFKLHRCILSARSEYLRHALQGKWKDKEVRTNVINPQVFDDFLKYIYTGRTAFCKDSGEEFIRLAEKCKMESLRTSLQRTIADVEFFELTKKGRVSVNTIVLESPLAIKDLQQDLTFLIEAGIPSEFSRWPPHFALPMMPTMPEAYFDMCLLVEGHPFYCHKLLMCTRSEYFDALTKNHFEESSQLEDKVQRFTLREVSANVISCVLYFIYTNNAPLREDNIFEVLEVADIYLLSGLKRICGNFLCDILSLENVILVLKLARYHQLTRLEDHCAAFIADNIVQFTESEEFRNLVISDAEEVKERENTDSIQIIDDVRCQISSKVSTFSEVVEADESLRIIDQMLEELGLDA